MADIKEREAAGTPFVLGAQSPDALQKHIKVAYGYPSKVAKETIEGWLNRDVLGKKRDTHNKRITLFVNRPLEIG